MRTRTAVLPAVLALCVVLAASACGPPGPAPSPTRPTSSRLAVVALPGKFVFTTVGGEMWVVRGDGTKRRRISHSPPGHLDFDPSWSPDGRRIVFRSDESAIPDPNGIGLDEIVVIDADGSDRRAIQPRTGGLFPDWSPEGGLIAFSGVSHPRDLGAAACHRRVQGLAGAVPEALTAVKDNLERLKQLGVEAIDD